MKRKHIQIFIALAALALPVFTLVTPHLAYASCIPLPLSGFKFSDCIFGTTSFISGLLFQIAGAFLTITGVLLNGTMVATLNIKQIVDVTTSIGLAWRTIRDFSSIFIIFLLLYASIKMILGLKDSNLGTLIKNIIIAGLLINFSLFITKFAVDASNIISLSFYSAIAPGFTNTSLSGGISTAFNDGGLSNVFMQSLDITQIAASNGALTGGGGDPNKDRTITMANIGGTVLMMTASFSFLFAAVAFAVRIGVLILLMAFSPIYFIGMIFPQTKEYADKWLNTLIAMCLFMPVYLFLMYVAVSVINDPNFFNFAKVTSIGSAAGTSNSLISAATIGIILQYIIAFFFINAPMLAAIEIGSKGSDIAVKFGQNVKKWSQTQLNRGVNTVGTAALQGTTAAWQGTAGRAASKISQNEGLKDFASNWKVGSAVYQGVKGLAGGYDKKLKEQVETRTKYGESLGYDQKAMNNAQLAVRGLQQDLAKAKAVGAPKATLDAIENTLGAAKGRVGEIENKRKLNYANRVNTRSIDTIYTKVARKNKLAAAKLQIPIKEKDLERKKEGLKETESEIRQLQRAITNNAAAGGIAAGTPTAAQTTEMNELLDEQSKKTAKLSAVAKEIDDLKLIK